MVLTIEQRKRFHNTGRCPFCGKSEFYEGPQGGLSMNIMCANSECEAKFNIAAWPLGPLMQCEVIGEPKSGPPPLATEPEPKLSRWRHFVTHLKGNNDG